MSGDHLDLLRRQDPDFLAALERRDRLVLGCSFIAILALGIALWAVVVNGQQSRDITKIQRTPCAAHPAGRACAKLRQRVARAEPIKGPCISYQRVTGSEGANCPRHFLEHRKGVVAQTPHTAPQPASPPAMGGGSGGEAPARPVAPSPSESSPPVEVPAPVSEPAGPLESVGGLVPELPCVTVAELASVACH